MLLEYDEIKDASAAMNHQWQKHKRRQRVQSEIRHRNHLTMLAMSITGYPPVSMPVDCNGCWNFDDPDGTIFYKRCYRDNHSGGRYKWYKRYANRSVRRYTRSLASGKSYRKVFDLAWEVD